MNTNRAVGASIVAVAAAVLVAGCGGAEQEGMSGMHHGTPPSASQPPAKAGQHNDADVVFAQGMIPHHAQAVEMSRLAPERARSPQVKDLARQIEAAQGPEIEMLTGWLRSWGVEAPHGDMPGMGHEGMHGMDHGSMPDQDMPGAGHGGMQGMMTPEDMQRLSQARGADFDRAFLTMMIAHHEGAVDMARTELEQGQFPEAKKMAQQIIDTQQAEIDTMRGLLQQS
ncbi:DUF305 domain-containing protein [Parasphingorhabdus pacifica]